MRVLTTSAVVGGDHRLIIQVPPDVPCGSHQVVLVLDAPSGTPAPVAEWQLPVHDVGPWPSGFTMSREDIYGDDDR
jgi:hypothetical protein